MADMRKRLIAAVHAEAKRHGMDDETRRALIRQVTGKSSSKDLSEPQLGQVLDAIKGKARRVGGQGRIMADSPRARKIRALWLSLYNLSVVADPSEAAIAHFAERQCNVMALQWVSIEDSIKVIEALKAWAVRDAGVCWDAYLVSGQKRLVDKPAYRVIEAQWRIMDGLGIGHPHVSVFELTDRAATRLIPAQGKLIREAKV